VESPSKLYAAVLGLTAFLVAVVAGLFSGSPGADVLSHAIVSMVVCYALGAVLGVVAGRAISEFVAGYRATNPATDLAAVTAEYELPAESAGATG
jgi:NhaP-type Na+/H+ or K+/H+ antiporter